MWFPIRRGFLRRVVDHVKAVDGVSLTAAKVQGNRVSVNLIPHTQEVTTIGQWRIGRRVNVETDILAKYVERLMETRKE